MRIAQVSPLYESVPPRLYGGTERVVSYLTEELVRQGHDVTLFASGDSQTSARLVATSPRALWLDPAGGDPVARHHQMLDELFARASEFDVLHFHTDYLHFPLTRYTAQPHLTTLHGRLDLPGLSALFSRFPEVSLVSISNAQRRPVPWAKFSGTVYHGLPADLHRPGAGRGGYLAFLGRLSPQKRPEWAIEIARRAGLPLRIAAKVDPEHCDYFEAELMPLMSQPGIEYVGEVDEAAKTRFLGDARALLFPLDWEEPFGLVLIEALACGTPVIAFRRGSVPEIIDDGVTGFVVGDIDQAAAAVADLPSLRRATCRQAFEARFTASRMAEDYVALFRAAARAPALHSLDVR